MFFFTFLTIVFISTIMRRISTFITTLIVAFFTLILSFFKKFSSELASSVKLDVLTGRIKEAKTLGVGEVETPDDEGKDDKNNNQKEPQPPHVRINFLNTRFNTIRSHFFGRGLTARSTSPTARISRIRSTARFRVRVVGALSGTTVGRLITSEGDEVVASGISVAGGGVSVLGTVRLGALSIDDQAGRIEEASGIVGSEFRKV